MALNRGLFVIPILMFLTNLSFGAEEESPTRWRMGDNNCQTIMLKNGKWEKTINTLPIDFEITGQIDSSSGTDWIVYSDGPKIKAAKKDCFTAIDLQPRLTPQKFKLVRRVKLAFSTWQESTSLTQANQDKFPLRANFTGVCPGYGIALESEKKIHLELSACAFLGTTEIGESAGETNLPPILYRSSGVRAIGLRAEPSFYWRFQSEDVSLGFTVPLLYRRVSWVEPGGGLQISRKNALVPGFVLAPRMERSGWAISPQLGFMQALKNTFWSFEFSYRL